MLLGESLGSSSDTKEGLDDVLFASGSEELRRLVLESFSLGVTMDGGVTTDIGSGNETDAAPGNMLLSAR